MSDISKSQERPCKVCGLPAVETSTGVAHVGGGEMTQRCENPSCGWKGSQYGKFLNCPRCGDGTRLVDDHKAS